MGSTAPKRFVHQEHWWISREVHAPRRPVVADRRKLARIAISVDIGIEAHQVEHLVDSCVYPLLVPFDPDPARSQRFWRSSCVGTDPLAGSG